MIDFSSYLDGDLIDKVKAHLTEKGYQYLDVVPRGDMVILDNPRLAIVVYFATICDKHDKIYQIWILAGGLICTYDFLMCPALEDAINYHIGLLVTRGFFNIVPTEKAVLG